MGWVGWGGVGWHRLVALVLAVLPGAALPHSPIPDPIQVPLCSPKYSVFCAASLIFCSWVPVVGGGWWVVGMVGEVGEVGVVVMGGGWYSLTHLVGACFGQVRHDLGTLRLLGCWGGVVQCGW